MPHVNMSPTAHMEHALDPISHTIDASGGPHVLIGCIASGGLPHTYVIGNLPARFRAEVFDAAADLLKRKAEELRKGGPGIIKPGDLRV